MIRRAVTVIASLIAKSLIAINVRDGTRYRLLDTTRAYAADKLAESGEADAIRRRHADYYCELFGRTKAEPTTPGSGAKGIAARAEPLGNVRAALEWSFSPHGDAQVGIALAAASAPLFLEMSLLTECHRWSERAIAALDDANRGGRSEFKLKPLSGCR